MLIAVLGWNPASSAFKGDNGAGSAVARGLLLFVGLPGLEAVLLFLPFSKFTPFELFFGALADALLGPFSKFRFAELFFGALADALLGPFSKFRFAELFLGALADALLGPFSKFRFAELFLGALADAFEFMGASTFVFPFTLGAVAPFSILITPPIYLLLCT
jgi:hypothetical protein